MMRSTIPEDRYASLQEVISSNALLVRNLQAICSKFELSRTGVKSELQNRLRHFSAQVYNDRDLPLFQQLESAVYEHAHRQAPGGRGANSRSSAPNRTNGSSSARHAATSTNAQQNVSPNADAIHSTITHLHCPLYTNRQVIVNPYARAAVNAGPRFKNTVFYEIRQQIGAVQVCEIMKQHRNTLSIPLKVTDHPELQPCENDSSYRLMLFCGVTATGVQDIVFPNQAEIKVNGSEVRANLRGIKKRPGTTKPVDITSFLKLSPPNYKNEIDFTYALTEVNFYLVLYVCRTKTVEELVASITRAPRITAESVRSELREKAKDDDIMTTSQVLSLKCPLSYQRLSIPCRGTSCAHIQCFDATSYLQLQEQGLTWKCPICNKDVLFDQIAWDEYVYEIIRSTPASVEQVTIEPNGEWSLPQKNVLDLGDDEDDVKIANPHNQQQHPRRSSSGSHSNHPNTSQSHSHPSSSSPAVSRHPPSHVPSPSSAQTPNGILHNHQNSNHITQYTPPPGHPSHQYSPTGHGTYQSPTNGRVSLPPLPSHNSNPSDQRPFSPTGHPPGRAHSVASANTALAGYQQVPSFSLSQASTVSNASSPIAPAHTPSLSSLPPKPASPAVHGRKRASAVIDLTLSDDEGTDGGGDTSGYPGPSSTEQARPAKRQNTQQLPVSSHR